MKEFRKRGLADVVAQIKDVLAGRPVYITFDLDCLDPTIAPAVSNIEAGEKGFDIDEAVGILHAVRGMNIVGGDVVCMDAKSKDHREPNHSADSDERHV